MSDQPKPTMGFLLNDVARMVRKLFEQRSKDLGLTRAQWQVLAYLRFYDGIRQGQLADMLDLEPISLSRVVDRLESAGFVERRPDAEDRRSKRLHLLPHALPVLEQLKTIGDGAKADMLEGVSKQQQEQLIATLTVMRGNLARHLALEGQERDGAPNVDRNEPVSG